MSFVFRSLVGRERGKGGADQFTLINQLLDPVEELDVVPVQNGRPLEEREQPWEVGEEGDVVHVGADGLEDVRRLAVGEHFGRLVERQVLHDVEDEKGEPFSDIHRPALMAFNSCEEQRDGPGDARVVSLERCGGVSGSGPLRK